MSCAALMYSYFLRYSAFSPPTFVPNVATRRLNYTPSIIHPLLGLIHPSKSQT
jgi:hypothetical protein